MSTKKEDLFGLNNDSENEDISADEEELEDSRFSKSRAIKQEVSDDESDDDEDNAKEDSDNSKEDSDNNKSAELKQETKTKDDRFVIPASEDEVESEDELNVEGYDAPKDMTAFGYGKKRIRPDKKIKALTPEELEKFEKARKNTGVCYLSRIPPFMPPSRVRSLLGKHAEIGRIFLVPEESKSTAKRKKYKKERRTNFIEGWVEFKEKKVAKALAEHLNMKEIGGKRKNEFYHETWNIKYLPKFKWHHLTEHRAQEKQARQQRLRNEIAQSNRENKNYIQNVERSKMLQNMEQKKRKREGEPSTPTNKKIQRTFSQREKVKREVDPKSSGKQYMEKMDGGMKSVLGSIFSKKEN